ncbi:uncharacterized protein BDR25DRAFT_82586 [Lindgomyces ingoldianus]|uniref:Uncharacterized protein n=1 Tax=Lindgomyces ingoldianus TaxID=673940 RepID=A0ACB6QFQ9_9PLEO|nr:uncharacterized protein BDR25DRAFT_82586 [Lindgomyces ingoldianus]KAF2465731.1 hypothetical protein BDR25DRAFT_82586 [Lindgomyces ingoldianus]
MRHYYVLPCAALAALSRCCLPVEKLIKRCPPLSPPVSTDVREQLCICLSLAASCRISKRKKNLTATLPRRYKYSSGQSPWLRAQRGCSIQAELLPPPCLRICSMVWHASPSWYGAVWSLNSYGGHPGGP